MEEIVYNWNFSPLEVIYNEDTLTNVVNIVHWQYSATHTPSQLMLQNIGTVSLDTPTTESFVPFENLTKEMVTDWVVAKIGNDEVSRMQTSLSASIGDKLHPIKGQMLPPW